MRKRLVNQSLRPDKYLSQIEHHLRLKTITERDAELIKEYLTDKMLASGGSITASRKNKIVNHITNFSKHFLSPEDGIDYSHLTDSSWRTAAGLLFTDGSGPRGIPFSQNTKHDYIVVLRPFLKWMIKRGYADSGLTYGGLAEVKNPPKQFVTKTAADLLSDEDVYKLLEHPNADPQLSALVALLYWTGARIGELLSLQWHDLTFENQLLKIRIYAPKTKTYRYSPCSEALQYVAEWRIHYPKSIAGGPVGDNCVFVSWDKDTNQYVQMQYYNARKRIQTLCDNVLHRHIMVHAFRASDITNTAKRGIPDSINKAIHWGNQGTQMLRTYTLLDDSDIDAAMLRRAGIEREKDELPVPKLCPICGTMNPPFTKTCRICGSALTHDARRRQIEIREAAVAAQQQIPVMQAIEIMADALGIEREVLLQKLSSRN